MKEYHPGDLDNMHQAAAVIDRPTDDEAENNFRSNFQLQRTLPKGLEVLDRLSANFAWSWLVGDGLFADLDPHLWERSGQNPRVVLGQIDELRLLQKLQDRSYLSRVEDFAKRMDAYLAEPRAQYGVVTPESPVAYLFRRPRHSCR